MPAQPSDSQIEAQLIRFHQRIRGGEQLNGDSPAARELLAEAVRRGLKLEALSTLADYFEALDAAAPATDAPAAAAPKPKRTRKPRTAKAPSPEPVAAAPATSTELPEAAELGAADAPKAAAKADPLAAFKAEQETIRAGLEASFASTRARRQKLQSTTAPAAPAAAAQAPSSPPPAKKPAAKKPPATPAAPKPIGKPLVLPPRLKQLDNPTVRFLAAREAADPGAGTFIICGDETALVGFDETGELLLMELEPQDKSGPTPDWFTGGGSLEQLGCHLYGPAGLGGTDTAQSLKWIQARSKSPKAKQRGAFYLTGALDADQTSLQTTRGAATARGLAELFCEWDDLPLDQQEQKVAWLQGLGFALTVVHSGSKSLHVHIHLDRVLPYDEALPLLQLLTALADSDICVVSKARPMRLAGAHRPSANRMRGGALTTEQTLLALADRCYSPAEVQQVLEAEATGRGWNVDHLSTRWSCYRTAKGQKPITWATAEEAWTRPALEAMAWSKKRRSSEDGTHDEPVEWRKEETPIGAKIRRAEAALLEEHGLADAYELVATSGTLEQRQVAKGYGPGVFELGFKEEGLKIKGQSPWSQYRGAKGVYSGNSLHLYVESQAFYCWATLRRGKLAEFAAHFCIPEIADPLDPTDLEQLYLARYLWDLAGLPEDEFEDEGDDDTEADHKAHAEALRTYETARNSKLTLAQVLAPDLASLLKMRADAFPVNELAMLPAFLCSCASILGTRYRTRVKVGHEEPMVLWIGLVGEPSSIKTPIGKQVLHPLERMDLVDQQVFDRDKDVPAEERDRPLEHPRKRMASDATLEGLCATLQGKKNIGMLCHYDELAGFIGSMDAYRGRGGPSKDRAHWLSMWSGGAINILRKGHDPIFIPETAVSVYGCVQQDKLTDMLHGDNAVSKGGDGFWARFLWCVPQNPFPGMNRNAVQINSELMGIAVALDSFPANSQPLVVTLGLDAWEIYAKQCDAWSLDAMHTYGARQAFMGKMRGYAARFAGLLHAIDHAHRICEHGGSMAGIDKEISAETMERALLLMRYFLNQYDALAPQVDGSGQGSIPSWVPKVLRLVEREKMPGDPVPEGVLSARDLVTARVAANGKEAKQFLLDLVQKFDKGRLVPTRRRDQIWWSPVALEDAGAGIGGF